MIVSASRRTDIPAFYPAWMVNRLRAGHCQVTNPRRPDQVLRVDLAPSAVDALVFWTKNPAPLLPMLDEIDRLGHRYYFLFTLNDYPSAWEPGVPSRVRRVEVFRDLARRIGADRVIWRYDPVILTRRMDGAYHARVFAELAGALQGATRRVILSILDRYRFIEARLAAAARATGDEMVADPLTDPGLPDLLRRMAETAGAHGMAIQGCAEPAEVFAAAGIERGRCIDPDLIQRLFAIKVAARKDPAQRKDCGCAVSRDIGALNTCPAGCVYCYATGWKPPSADCLRDHDPGAPNLVPSVILHGPNLRLRRRVRGADARCDAARSGSSGGLQAESPSG